MTKLNVYELLVLHLNVNRKLGDEIKHHNFILEHRINVMKIIQKLIDNQLIYTTNAPNVALNYLKVNELKVILRDNKLKLSGNKAELIDRLIHSLDDSSFNLLDLPQIYKATSLGKNILEETDYIDHFYPHHSITIIDAYNAIQSADHDVDKIEYIYNFHIYLNINENEFDTAGHYAERLSYYYLIESPNEVKQRIYVNLSIYLIGMSELLRYDRIAYFNHSFREDYRFNYYKAKTFYEKSLIIDETSKNKLIEEYLNDIKNFIEPDLFLATKFINILFAKMKNNREDLNKQYNDIENYFKTENIEKAENKTKLIQNNDIETKSKSGCLLFVLFPLLPLLNYLL